MPIQQNDGPLLFAYNTQSHPAFRPAVTDHAFWGAIGRVSFSGNTPNEKDNAPKWTSTEDGQKRRRLG